MGLGSGFMGSMVEGLRVWVLGFHGTHLRSVDRC